tara:strand:+ start:154 stop:564 length:411 start_codon:yes stop_codon:yes gene_type:complete
VREAKLKSLDKKLLRNAKGLINTILTQTIENPDNPESMNFFQGDAYRFYFLMSFMNEFFKGSDISQEYAISLVPQKYASRIKRLQILKQAVRLGYIIESKSNVDKRRRIYIPSDSLIDDFLKYANHMTEANIRKAS